MRNLSAGGTLIMVYGVGTRLRDGDGLFAPQLIQVYLIEKLDLLQVAVIGAMLEYS